MSPEFSRPVRIDTIGSAPRAVAIEANEAEKAALAKRFDLVAIGRLAAEASLVLQSEAVIAEGIVRAAVVQSCVATGVPVKARVEVPFRIEFRPLPTGAGEEEIELGAAELDVVFHDGAAIDLGEAAAETLSLALNPYPRAPGAEQALREAGVKNEEDAKRESSPFAALRDKLRK
jgi:uncharacterized metal-binding protein YceD (DUF177 family)